jgi:hypothetical protein
VTAPMAIDDRARGPRTLSTSSSVATSQTAVESKLRGNPLNIGVTFIEWLTRLKALCHS